MSTGNFADYASGSRSNSITFVYTVQEGDNTQALDAWDAPAHGELSVQEYSHTTRVIDELRVELLAQVCAQFVLQNNRYNSMCKEGSRHVVQVLEKVKVRLVPR